MKTLLFFMITLLGGLWLQVIQNHFLGGSIFSVQFLIVATIYWGLTHDAVSALIIGFLWGLLSDAASLSLLGERALLFCAVGFCAGFFRRQLDDTKPWTQGVFTFLASCGVVTGEYLIEHIFLRAQRPIPTSVWLQPLWNALAAPLLFLMLRSWDMVWDIRERDR